MAASSIEYDFAVNDRQNAERLIRALTRPASKAKPVKELSGKEAIDVLIKWKNEK